MVDKDSERIITEEELGERFDEILAELRDQHETALISRRGRTVARMVPIYGGKLPESA